MAIQTTPRGFRHPSLDGADTPDVPRDIRALAYDIDGQFVTVANDSSLPAFGKVGRRAYSIATKRTFLDIGTAWVAESSSQPTVSTLPSSPVDGQEAIYQTADMLTRGEIWRFRYNAGASGSYKWEFVGGSDARKFVIDYEVIPSQSGGIAHPAHPGPTIAIPMSGIYDIRIGAEFTNVTSSGANTYMAVLWKGAHRTPSIDPITGEAAYNSGEYIYSNGTAPSPSNNDSRREGHMDLRLSFTDAPGDAMFYCGQAGIYISRRYMTVKPVRVG